MNIVHIAPTAPYNDYWGYQENILPKYQKRLGHNVTLIITNLMHEDGEIIETNCADYTLDDGVRVIRLKRKEYFSRLLTRFNAKLCVYDLLKKLRPDFIFLHGLASVTIFEAIKYKKKINKQCKIVMDSHSDYDNSGICKNWKHKIIRFLYRLRYKKALRYVERFYGVTPWRKTYIEDYYQIPSTQTDVLIMGADDEKIDFAHRDQIRSKIREAYSIGPKEFLIVTGGKIDAKKNITQLMRACSGFDDIKLLVFGNVHDSIKDEFYSLVKNNSNIIYIGWIDADKVYDYFFAADLAFFPGGHSVLWEQACAAKVPCVFGRWEGTDHVNNGGNSDFIFPVNEQTIKEKIVELKFTEKYQRMKEVAESKNTDIYLYSEIAKKSLECMK